MATQGKGKGQPNKPRSGMARELCALRKVERNAEQDRRERNNRNRRANGILTPWQESQARRLIKTGYVKRAKATT